MSPDELWQREYERWLVERARRCARHKWRLANVPGYRERVNAYARAYMRRYRARAT